MLFRGLSEIGARGRGCTCTGDALDVVSLLLDYASDENWIIGLLDGWMMVACPKTYETCLSADSAAVLNLRVFGGFHSGVALTYDYESR